MERNVNAPTASLKSILSSLNVNCKNIRVTHCGFDNDGQSDNFMIEFETAKGCYSIPCSFPYSSLNNKVKYPNTVIMESVEMNTFSAKMLFSIIMNMSENEDEAVAFLFEGLCTFWDTVFKNVYGDINSRIKTALVDLNNHMTKDEGLTEKVYFTNYKFFRWFVTGPLGNQLYYYGGLSERSEVKRHIKGEVW